MMFLLCWAFPISAFAERISQEEKEVLTYESPIFTDGGESFIPEETRIENGKEYRLVSKRIRNAKKAGE